MGVAAAGVTAPFTSLVPCFVQSVPPDVRFAICANGLTTVTVSKWTSTLVSIAFMQFAPCVTASAGVDRAFPTKLSPRLQASLESAMPLLN